LIRINLLPKTCQLCNYHLKFIAGINYTGDHWKCGLITGVKATSDKFLAGVVDTGEQLITGLIDTGDKHSFVKISANYRKNF